MTVVTEGNLSRLMVLGIIISMAVAISYLL